MKNFFKRMDRGSIEGLEKTKALQAEQLEKPVATEKQQQVQGFREILRDIRNNERMELATRVRPAKGVGIKDVLTKGNILVGRGMRAVRGAAKTVGGILSVADKLADGFASALSPVLTPEQKAEARFSELQREEKADESREISRFTASQAQYRQEEETERSRDRGRERDR